MSTLGEESLIQSPGAASTYNVEDTTPSIMEDNGTPSDNVEVTINDTTQTNTDAHTSSHAESVAGAMCVYLRE